MVLSTREGKLGLQEQLVPRNQTAIDGRSDCLTDRRLVVMPPLICRIDASEPLLQSELRETRRAVLLPGGAVEKARNLNVAEKNDPVGHALLRLVFGPRLEFYRSTICRTSQLTQIMHRSSV